MTKTEVARTESVAPKRLFDWPGWFSWPDWPSWPGWSSTAMTPFLETLGFTDERFMRVEEFEDAGTHVVRAEIPGVDPDKDVDIYFTDHTLRIEAKRQVEKQTKEKGGYRSEFRYGHYLRSVPLPMGADVNDVKATYKDGVLEVRVPVDHETAKQTKIPVQRL